MELIAITYCYKQDNQDCNKVVGIFEPSQLAEAIDDIKNGYGEDKTIKAFSQDTPTDNFFLEYTNDEFFYSGTYTIGELKL